MYEIYSFKLEISTSVLKDIIFISSENSLDTCDRINNSINTNQNTLVEIFLHISV